MSIESEILNLPTTRLFIEATVNTLLTKSVVVLIPETVSREMVARHINNRLEVLRESVRDVPYVNNTGPVMAISHTLNVRWPSPGTARSVRNLLTYLDFTRSQIVHIRDFNTTNSSDPVQRRQWMDLISDWVHERNEIGSNDNPTVARLCLVAKLKDFDFDPPVEELGLRVLWWYGFPSSLEMRLSCRIANEEDSAEEHRNRWREQVLPALVAGDVNLADYMWDVIFESPEDIISKLVDYAHEELEIVGCEDRVARSVNLENPSGYQQGPPRDLWDMWASGGLVSTPEYGSEIHPALLAFRDEREVERRLWRGQAEFLLPILNDIRIKICDDMTDRFGQEWPINPSPPQTSYELEAVEDNPRGAELGHIEYLLLEVPRFKEGLFRPAIEADMILSS